VNLNVSLAGLTTLKVVDPHVSANALGVDKAPKIIEGRTSVTVSPMRMNAVEVNENEREVAAAV